MNMVNEAFARAAIRTAPEIKAFLTKVLEPVFKGRAAQTVDDMADHMGRNVK